VCRRIGLATIVSGRARATLRVFGFVDLYEGVKPTVKRSYVEKLTL
jgi:hypothetical protein